MTSYAVGQWTGTDWIARVVTLKRVPKHAPCDTLLYLWPKEEWVWANTVTVEQSATRLPAVSVDTDKVRVKLALLLMPYGRPTWVASEVGVSPAAITQLQDRKNLNRWQYMPPVEQVQGDIASGMKMRDALRKYGVSRVMLNAYLEAQGTSYKELVREQNDRRATLGLPTLRLSGGIGKTPGKAVAADTRIQAQPQAHSALPAGHRRELEE